MTLRVQRETLPDLRSGVRPLSQLAGHVCDPISGAVHGPAHPHSASPAEPDRCCPQVALAVERSRHEGRPLHYAAARAASWLLTDLPARVGAALFSETVRTPVRVACATVMFGCHLVVLVRDQQQTKQPASRLDPCRLPGLSLWHARVVLLAVRCSHPLRTRNLTLNPQNLR